jgi:hypothetical protein
MWEKGAFAVLDFDVNIGSFLTGSEDSNPLYRRYF